ncbi:hypothetical protein B0T14DRAFT_80746 [Immersiella caudata]|uniref:Uncharacterized protein n=1 Tax=Immersiella caudata TaxID=314043 RepID=A0AA39XGV1_9PEZI|nr:hypothetical protein B0T14DRAFT_80746 [Immersiella caudata]
MVRWSGRGSGEEGGSVLRQGDEHPDWEELKPSAQPAIARSVHGSRPRGAPRCKAFARRFGWPCPTVPDSSRSPDGEFWTTLCDNLTMSRAVRPLIPAVPRASRTWRGRWCEQMQEERSRLRRCDLLGRITCQIPEEGFPSPFAMNWAQPSPTSSLADRTVPQTNPVRQRPICCVAPNAATAAKEAQRCRDPGSGCFPFRDGSQSRLQADHCRARREMPV